MAYIGRQLARGENKLFDDISSSFNGSTTTFNLTVSSIATATATAYQLFVSLGGVMQKPNTDFTTAGNQITFTTAPAAGLSCWIMMQGDTIDQAAIPDASVSPSKIAGSGDFAFPADVRLKDGDGSHYVGFQAPTTVSTNKIWTLPAADGSANQYLKTDGSGTLSWGSDSTSDPSKMPLAGGTFTGDVTFTGDASNGLWDKSASAFVANLTGNVTGNASGSAATVTGAAQSAITSLGTLTGLTVAGDTTLNAQGDLRFADSDSSNWVAFQAPATITSNVTWTLPAADGSANQLLTTNGSGTLSWSTVAGGISSDAQRNTVGGTDAGTAIVTGGQDNTLIGYQAGDSITTAEANVIIGSKCGGLLVASGANHNVVIGFETLGSNVTGTRNIAIGTQALYEYEGNDNVAVGVQAGQQNVSGITNTFIGNYAGRGDGNSSGHVHVGYKAGYARIGGDHNTFVGYQAGYATTTASNCIAIGQALENATSASKSLAIGYLAGNGISTGDGNIAIGDQAIGGAGTLSEGGNICIGTYAGYDLDTGFNNTFVGYTAGMDVTSGQRNTCIGEDAGKNLTTGSNNTFLGKVAGYSGSPSGNVTTGSNIVCLGNSSVTDLYCADTSISSSDSRDKADVANFTHGLSWVNKLNPITYKWDKRDWYVEYNEDGSVKSTATPDGSKKKARQHIGFLAQDVLAIEQADGFASKKDDMLVVNLNEDETAYGLKYERLVPVLVNAVKELSTEVNTLKTKVAALEAA